MPRRVVDLPERTRLYNIELMGSGTAAAESLSSVIKRLAALHCVTTSDLVYGEIAPLLGRQRVGGGDDRDRDGYFRSLMGGGNSSLVGLDENARRWTGALSLLTGVDLRHTTLMPWSERLPARYLFTAERRYCPRCYEHDVELHRQPYDRLLFRFACLPVCIDHGTYLADHCPFCGRALPDLANKSVPGRCDWCLSWLGRTGKRSFMQKNIRADEAQWFAWLSDQLGRLVAAEPHGHWDAPSVVNQVIEAYHRGKAGSLAGAIGIGKGTVAHWRSGASQPSLPSWLMIASACRLSLVDLLLGRLQMDFVPHIPAGTDGVERPSHVVDWRATKRGIRRAIAAEPPPSLRQIALQVGVNERSLRHRFPAECAQLRVRRVDHLRLMKASRLEELKRLVVEKVEEVMSQGLHASRRRVEALLPPNVSLREPSLQEAWREASNGRRSTNGPGRL
jgi:hypothetical protein